MLSHSKPFLERTCPQSLVRFYRTTWGKTPARKQERYASRQHLLGNFDASLALKGQKRPLSKSHWLPPWEEAQKGSHASIALTDAHWVPQADVRQLSQQKAVDTTSARCLSCHQRLQKCQKVTEGVELDSCEHIGDVKEAQSFPNAQNAAFLEQNSQAASFEIQ